ncbi:dynein axonemal assembly factor 5-like isoform X2 [Hydractinia symbiolongicarpus]|uniref:dynein axonemal assembly factor 5-like isoform X2 n=1 Tax=Hydractinia symbiolongicarpus TaxID=13093 RepID=UPI00254FDC84|nr:dynein axonemal assembly factor 5-like isoform X2 [Hydractinia symbiolongicarpus]
MWYILQKKSQLKLFRFCSRIKCPNEYLAYIIPTIHQRLAADEVVEPTEEIRLLLIESLSKLVDIYDQEIDTYIDELVQILQMTLVDPFGDVRKASCLCTNKIASTSPERFYQQGEALVSPLLKSLSHQHNKVRAAVLKTIGIVVLATSGRAVDDVFTHIAQRTFDHSAPVRLIVTEVVGKWILELRDRYSFFQKLIPLLLSGLSDDMPEIREESLNYFRKAGKLYEEENENDFKDKLEYHTVKHYEHLLVHDRPSLGCRVLIQRNFSKILPAIVHDITDWTPATRIKSAQLLYHLVFYCEDHVTMHMELLSQGLYKAAQDEEVEVKRSVVKTAELIGLFVEPAVYCKLILSHLENVSSSSPLSLSSSLAILAAYIRGANYELLGTEIKKICKCLESTDICSSVDATCQTELTACLKALISKTGINHADISCSVFKMLLNVFAVASSDEIRIKVHSLMDNLAKMLNMDSRYKLFDSHAQEILTGLKSTCDVWTNQSPECYIFVSLLSEAGPSISCLLDTAVPMFVQCCDISKDAEMRQKMFTLMSQLVVNSSNDACVRTMYQKYTIGMIKQAILPNCVWKAGRTAAAIRAVAISFLWALLQSGVVTDDHLRECYNELHTQLITCLDDFSETTRLVTVKVLLKLLIVCKAAMQVEQLHVIYPELLKRMDDSSNEVRIVTCKAFSAYFSALPEDYDRDFFKAHLEFIYKTLLIHLDDPDETVQKCVTQCLQDGAHLHPGLLKQEVEDVALKHRSRKFCDELIEVCKSKLAS